MNSKAEKEMILLTGNSHPELAEKIARFFIFVLENEIVSKSNFLTRNSFLAVYVNLATAKFSRNRKV